MSSPRKPSGRARPPLLQQAFPSLVDALEGIRAHVFNRSWDPGDFAAYVDASRSDAVVVKLATRRYWLELGAVGVFRKLLSATEAIDDGRFAVELFANGAQRGFNAVRTAVMGVAGLFGGDAVTWPLVVHKLGTAAGVLVPTFLALSVGSRVARVALLGFRAATFLVTGSIWLANQAQWAWRATQIGWLLVTNSATAATVRARVATIANTAAAWLARGAQVAWNGILWLGTAAETAFTGQIVANTVATNAGTTSMVAAEAATATFVLTVGAAVAAVGALIAAWYQWQELDKQTGGHTWEGFKGGVGSVLNGGGFREGFAGAVDDAMNQDAYRRYDQENPVRSGGFGPYGAPAPQPADAGNPWAAPAAQPGPAAQSGQAGAGWQADLSELVAALKADREKAKIEVEVKAPPGTETKQTAGGAKVPIKRTSSGAFNPAPAR